MGFQEVMQKFKKEKNKQAAGNDERQAKFNAACREMMPEMAKVHNRFGVDIVPIINYGPQGAIPMFAFTPQRSGAGEEFEGVQPLIPQPMMDTAPVKTKPQPPQA